MIRTELDSCEAFKAILASYAPPSTPAQHAQLEGYVSLIFMATQGWKISTFERACMGVIKTMGRGQKPMPEDFGKALNDNRGENLAGAPGCDSCKQTGFVYAPTLNTIDGRAGEIAQPCPQCRPRHPYKDIRPREGWVILDQRQEPHLTRMARSLGPVGAQYVIDQIDAKKTEMPEEICAILVQKVSEVIAPEREASADVQPVNVEVCSSEPSGPQRGEGHVFEDGSKLDDDDIPF